MSKTIAVEIPAASYCNLDCVYCYLAKCEALPPIHKRWKKLYESGEFISILHDTFGKDLDTISLWGTEPTLGTKEILSHIEEMKATFPKLKGFSTSSNMLLIDNLIDAIDMTTKHGLKFNLQMSIDGPTNITDGNRGKGTTAKVVKNLRKLASYVSKKDNPLFSMHFKPTLTVDNFRTFVSKDDALLNYVKFFDDLMYSMQEDCPSLDKYMDIRGGIMPTIVMPGKYTVEDGKIYSEYYSRLTDIIDKNKFVVLDPNALRKDQIYFRVQQVISDIANLFKDYRMSHDSSCSAGRSMECIDMEGRVHLCHRTLWLDDPGFVKDSEKYTIDNMDSSSTITNKVNSKAVLDNYTAKLEPSRNNYNLRRLRYIEKGYHNSFQLRFNMAFGLIIQMQKGGQVSPKYTCDSIHTRLLAHLLATRYQCPADNLMMTGSAYAITTSVARMLGNGVTIKATEDIISGKYEKR